MANQSKSFGIFSGSGGGGASGVTSVAAGTGIVATPDPITATGTISLGTTNGLVSSFVGTTSPSTAMTPPTGKITMYDVTSTPFTNATATQNGRVYFGVATGATNERFGVGGLATGDSITLTSTLDVVCTAGNLFAANVVVGGIFQNNAPTISPAAVLCDGSTQNVTINKSAFSVSNTGIAPSNPSVDFMEFNWSLTGGSGTVQFSAFNVSVTQYSD